MNEPNWTAAGERSNAGKLGDRARACDTKSKDPCRCRLTRGIGGVVALLLIGDKLFC